MTDYSYQARLPFTKRGNEMIPVILSGGSGTRLWPVSRTKLPKQFCDLFSQTLHSMTITRLQQIGSPWIITSQALRDLTYRDAKMLGISVDQVLLEPQSRNTAPAIALLCHILNQRNLTNEVVGIFPADHLVEKEPKFLASLKLAQDEALKDKIVTLGIHPTYPATGYGYIQVSNKEDGRMGEFSSHSVLKFHEKPNEETAKNFVEAGSYFWNAGIFIFKVSSMIEAFKNYQPTMWNFICQIKENLSNLKEIYEKVENISIDYAIMEKLGITQLTCVPCDVGWNDVGSWDAIQEILGDSSNTETSSAAKIEVKASGNFIHSALDKKYAFVEVDDLIVVDTNDALLVMKKGSGQKVKDVVDNLKLRWPHLTQEHTFEIRPWGQYEVLKDKSHFKSKVIEVLPNEQISYQSHAKREEHWLVTKGVGVVILDDQTIPVKAGTYVKIPLGAKHRIRNTGDVCVEFVEVQLGTYFGEDDIIRYKDDYQRM
jgi:mannose-1-phosphate guanylyltransferase/mannose-1-phosphate guanylyltransferase/mannose-6-phosphate isomerase